MDQLYLKAGTNLGWIAGFILIWALSVVVCRSLLNWEMRFRDGVPNILPLTPTRAGVLTVFELYSLVPVVNLTVIPLWFITLVLSFIGGVTRLESEYRLRRDLAHMDRMVIGKAHPELDWLLKRNWKLIAEFNETSGWVDAEEFLHRQEQPKNKSA